MTRDKIPLIYGFKVGSFGFVLHIGKLVIDIGWFNGADCGILDMKIMQIVRFGRLLINILYVQVLKFTLALTYDQE